MIFLTIFELVCEGMFGSCPMTVFRPILDMSLSCSLSLSMFEQRASTMISTWISFTLDTSGPRLFTNRVFIRHRL